MSDEEIRHYYVSDASLGENIKRLQDSIKNAEDDTVIMIIEKNADWAETRAVALAEQSRRQWARQKELLDEQKRIADKQLETSQQSVKAAKGSERVARLALVVTFAATVATVVAAVAAVTQAFFAYQQLKQAPSPPVPAAAAPPAATLPVPPRS